MKRFFLLFICFTNVALFAADIAPALNPLLRPRRTMHCSKAKVGRIAPDFEARAIVGSTVRRFSLKDFEDRFKLIVFYPADFSVVCPTELIALQAALPKFKSLNTEVLAISTDSIHSHKQWLQTPQDKGGVEGLEYPLIADPARTIARSYGVLDRKSGLAQRAVFILDKYNIIQAMMVTNMSTGRNVDEIVRLVEAIQFTQEQGKMCPVNWQPGQEGIEQPQQKAPMPSM